MSVEFAGNFQSLNGKWWKPEKYGTDYPTPEQLEAGPQLLRVLQTVGFTHVFAHRQSSASRGNDPGPEIWRAVGQWAEVRRRDQGDKSRDEIKRSSSTACVPSRQACLKRYTKRWRSGVSSSRS